MQDQNAFGDVESADAGNVSSDRRTTRPIFAVVGAVLLAMLPLTVWRLTLWSVEEAEKERVRQEQLEAEINDVREAVREGEAGEAFNRLFAEDHEEYLRNEAEQNQ